MKESLVGTENITGKTEVITRDLSRRVLERVMESGKNPLETVINMKESTLLAKRKDMVFSLGITAIYTKETIIKMFVKAMERCTGLMEVITRGNGRAAFKKEKVIIFRYRCTLYSGRRRKKRCI